MWKLSDFSGGRLSFISWLHCQGLSLSSNPTKASILASLLQTWKVRPRKMVFYFILCSTSYYVVHINHHVFKKTGGLVVCCSVPKNIVFVSSENLV